MKIALLTGTKAYELVSKIAKEVEEPGIELIVIKLPIEIAAMMNVEFLKGVLPKYMEELRDVDLVIAPGLTQGDLSELRDIIGKEVVKGTRYAYDIPLMIKALRAGARLRADIPADEVIKREREELELRTLEELRRRAGREHYFKIGELPVSPHYPLIIAEIYVSEGYEDIGKLLGKYPEADILALGFPLGYNRDKAARILEEARAKSCKPIGLDSPDPELIKLGLDIGVDLVLSLTESRARQIGYWEPRVAAVVVPEGGGDIGSLERGLAEVAEIGVRKIIVDPILEPPGLGLAKSINRYMEARRKFPDRPLLMGVGNVTELIDADSPGVNALLAAIGVEIGVELFLTVEASVKTRGAVRELRRALETSLLSRAWRTPPKDFSRNLLILKDKRKASPAPPEKIDVIARDRWGFEEDPAGSFKIYVDYERGILVAEHYPPSRGEPDIVIGSGDPYAILNEIKRRGLASLLEHYAYLASELQKAYIALKLGKEYVQDRELF